jgi:MFS transporter, DHA1 family, inner membrane transport protein
VTEHTTVRLYPRLTLLATGLFLVGTNAFVIAGLLPEIGKSLGVDANQVSYSITWYSVVVAVATPLIAIVLARMSRTVLMVAGLVVFALGGVIAATSDSLLAFTIGRIIAGIGGAALVPTATAAGAALAPAERRGRALAFVGVGFTLAVAVGSPLGTALGAAGTWRLPLWVLVVTSLALAVVIATAVRGVPIAEPISLAKRFAPLRDLRIIAPLGTTLLMVAGFNIAYIFSSEVTSAATGKSGTVLALLLLIFGVSAVIGTVVSGPLTDRLGSRPIAISALVVDIVALLLIPLAHGSFVLTAIVFIVWGFASFAPIAPVQARIVSVDPGNSSLSMSWYTSAMYFGIAIAPLLGAAASTIGVQVIPVAAAIVTALALLVFQAGYLREKH